MGFDRILGSAIKTFDAQVLLDPFKKQLDLPTATIQLGNSHRGQSKIERYWAGLEHSWNGHLRTTAETVLNRARNFSWRGTQTVVSLAEKVYEKGIKLCGQEKTLKKNFTKINS